MKTNLWPAIIGLVLVAAAPVQAQLSIGFGVTPYGGGAGFCYHGRHVRTGGGFASFGFPGFYGSPWGYPYFGAPWGVVQNRVSVAVVAPQPVVIPPPEPEYDLTGVDLDLVTPPQKLGPRGLEPQPEPKKAEPPPRLPGKDVSVPRASVRPGEPQQPPAKMPKAPPPPQQPGPPAWLQPPQPHKDPRQEARQQIIQGVTAFQAQEYGRAAQRFRIATGLDPASADGWFWLAQARFALGRYPEAAAAIESGMKHKRDWPALPFRPRADLYKGIEAEWVAHLTALRQAVKDSPKSAPLLFLLAHQLWFDDRQAEATGLLQQARPLAADPAFIDRFLKAALPGVVAAM